MPYLRGGRRYEYFPTRNQNAACASCAQSVGLVVNRQTANAMSASEAKSQNASLKLLIW